MIKTAVVLVAGKGTRLRSVTNNEIPKPFLPINGISLIERSIEKLTDCGIEKIILVTGHLDHFFEGLKNKYSNIITVKNEEFATTGNMKSFYTAKELVGKEDVLLIEGDLIYEKLGIVTLLNSEKKDAVLLSEDKYYGDDYYYELIGDKIGKMSNDREDFNGKYAELTGINKISNGLYKEMCEYSEKSSNKKIGYEYCLEGLCKVREINYERVEGVIWAEIDDENQLNQVIESVYPKLLKKGER
ncbi:MAG: phosphocholine cytidylyltransferase family protein [Psychrilyobacter sp.]|uniref:phosphocholine cytidylyltransferase family protein n=1 Tax=Psychrilyobacter sp. TaxID=2586924 RepID=UPI003C7945F0